MGQSRPCEKPIPAHAGKQGHYSNYAGNHKLTLAIGKGILSEKQTKRIEREKPSVS